LVSLYIGLCFLVIFSPPHTPPRPSCYFFFNPFLQGLACYLPYTLPPHCTVGLLQFVCQADGHAPSQSELLTPFFLFFPFYGPPRYTVNPAQCGTRAGLSLSSPHRMSTTPPLEIRYFLPLKSLDSILVFFPSQ